MEEGAAARRAANRRPCDPRTCKRLHWFKDGSGGHAETPASILMECQGCEQLFNIKEDWDLTCMACARKHWFAGWAVVAIAFILGLGAGSIHNRLYS